MITKLTSCSPKSLYGTIASYITYLFRSSKNHLGRFVDDLDGIGEESTDKVNSAIASLLKDLVDMLDGNKELMSVLKILDALKWIFRGKEGSCVIELKLHNIFFSLHKNVRDKEEVQHSLIESGEILVEFAIKKIQDVDQENYTGGGQPQLGKARSTFDETSITNILSQTLRF